MKKLIERKQYVFLDESGRPEILSAKNEDLVEGGKTSKFLVICAVVTEDPFAIQEQVFTTKLQGIRSESLRKHLSVKRSLEVFHASSDSEPLRSYILEAIKNITGFKGLMLVADKNKVYEGFKRDRENFYNAMCGQLLKRVLHTHVECSIIISRKDSNLGIQKNLNAEIDRLRLEFFEEHGTEVKTKLSFEHNPHYSHSVLQVADYLGWAVFQVFENNERKYFDVIKDKVSFIHDIFNKKVYTKENPL